MRINRAAIRFLCLCCAAAFFFAVPCSALVFQPGQGAVTDTGPQEPQSWTVSLESRVIGEGEHVALQTISSAFAGRPGAEAYYPGELTVELEGPIVVESGGSLTIGTLTIGSDQQASPVLSGTLGGEPLIVVKAGGSLSLCDVTLALAGEGFLVRQEAGASVTLTAMEAPGLIDWGPPLVENEERAPEDLWLPEGTVLTQEDLPQTFGAYVVREGRESWEELALRWDLSSYDGQSSGELELTGVFLDTDGEPLLSRRPLRLLVHWSEPDALAVTDAVFRGDQAGLALLAVRGLPQDARVWGEVSEDGGKTWTRFPQENFFLVPYGEDMGCAFQAEDREPRLYRVAACAGDETVLRSEAFLLPVQESEDQGGNRGGAVTPVPDHREPIPQAEPVGPADPGETGETTTQPENGEAAGSGTPEPQEPPGVSSAPAPPASPDAEPSVSPAPAREQEPAVAAYPPEPAQLFDETVSRVPEEGETGALLAPESASSPSESSPQTAAEAPAANAPADQASSGPAVSAPESPEQLSPAGQGALALAGVAVCAGVGAAVAAVRSARKR